MLTDILVLAYAHEHWQLGRYIVDGGLFITGIFTNVFHAVNKDNLFINLHIDSKDYLIFIIPYSSMSPSFSMWVSIPLVRVIASEMVKCPKVHFPRILTNCKVIVGKPSKLIPFVSKVTSSWTDFKDPVLKNLPSLSGRCRPPVFPYTCHIIKDYNCNQSLGIGLNGIFVLPLGFAGRM